MTTVDRVLAITNAAAGSADDETVEQVVQLLRQRADVEVAATSSMDELDEVVGKVAGRRLVVIGGDGSLHAVVAALHKRGECGQVPVAVIPLGTGNDLARTVGIPLDPMDAAQLALQSGPRPLDLLEDDVGGIVLNAVHVGLGAEAARTGQSAKKLLGAKGYAVGAAAAGLKTGGWRLKVIADGEVITDGTQDMLMVAVTVGQSIGGGTPIAPDAVVDDGKAEIVVSSASGPLARLKYGIDLRSGSHVNRDDVITMRAREVRVSGDSFPLNADGEVEDEVTDRAWRVVHHGWQLVTPTTEAKVRS